MDDHKKISFGFNKSKKLTLLPKPDPEHKKLELIECLEGQAIKILGGESVKENLPLVIPMKNPNKKLVNLEEIVKNQFSLDATDETLLYNKPNVPETSDDTKTLSLDEQAAKELLKDAQNGQAETDSTKVTELPISDKPVFQGETESTLDDYENVPIQDFGLAVLRGMGWKDGEGIGKNSKIVRTSQPTLRPKGMGLGADKLTSQGPNFKPAVDKEGKTLSCVKGAYVKIIAGHHKEAYAQIVGLDDESGRFIVKTALNNLTLSLNEFLVIPVTKEEFVKNSKVINNEKYQEYLKKKDTNAENVEKLQEKSSKSIIKSETQRKQRSISPGSSENEKYHSKRRSRNRETSESSTSEDEKHHRKKKNKRKKSESDDEKCKMKDKKRDRSRSRKHKTKKKHKDRR